MGYEIIESQAVADVKRELERARGKFPPINSLHEGYAIIKEELDEVWDEVKKKERSLAAIRTELIQTAAMAVRMAEDCC